MALEYSFGVVQWASSATAGTTYVISGLSFQPKALRFYTSGIYSATSAQTVAQNLQRTLGLATSPSDRKCIAAFDDNGEATILCGAGYFDNAVIATLDGSTTVAGLLDLDSIASDGFTLVVDDQTPQSITVIWEAWGGDDITAAATGEISEPASTGDVDYTVTGSFEPSVVMFGGSQATGTAPTAEGTDAGFCVGFASGGSVSNNATAVTNTVDGGANTLAQRYALDGECLAMLPVGGGNPDSRATMTQFNADGFRLNWIARALTGRKSIYLAIAGGSWQAGGLVVPGTTVGSTASVSGAAFQPKGICFTGQRNTESVAGTFTVTGYISMGSGTSTTSRVSTAHLLLSGQAATTANIGISYDQLFGDYNLPGRALDISSINVDGFTVIREGANEGLANVWYGYLMFGDGPASPPARIPRGVSIGHPFIH